MKKDKTIDDVLLRLTINARALKTIFIAPCIPSIDLMEQHILITKAEQEIKAIIIGKLEGLKKESIYHNPDMSDLDFKIISAEYKSHNQAIDQAIDKFKTDKE